MLIRRDWNAPSQFAVNYSGSIRKRVQGARNNVFRFVGLSLALQFLVTTVPTRADILGMKRQKPLSNVRMPCAWYFPSSCILTAYTEALFSACKHARKWFILAFQINPSEMHPQPAVWFFPAQQHCLYSGEIFMQTLVCCSKGFLCLHTSEPMCMSPPNMASTEHNLC